MSKFSDKEIKELTNLIIDAYNRNNISRESYEFLMKKIFEYEIKNEIKNNIFPIYKKLEKQFMEYAY